MAPCPFRATSRSKAAVVVSVEDRVVLERWAKRPKTPMSVAQRMTNRKLRRSARRSIRQLTEELSGWIATWNSDPRPFVWRRTAGEILDNLKKYLTNV